MPSRHTRVPIGVALALVAGTAFAQGSVTLYGIADTAVEWSDADANRAFGGTDASAGGARRMISSQPGNAKGSRLGLRGTEDLAGGLRAIFAIEHRLGVDTGSQSNPAFWNGQAWVGLDGRWGRLRRREPFACAPGNGVDPALWRRRVAAAARRRLGAAFPRERFW